MFIYIIESTIEGQVIRDKIAAPTAGAALARIYSKYATQRNETSNIHIVEIKPYF